MDPKLSKLIKRIKELEKEVVAEEKSKEEKRRVKELTRELIEIIKEYWDKREFIAEIVKLVGILENINEKLEKTYLKLELYISDLKLIENEKIRKIAKNLEEIREIIENLEVESEETLDDYRLDNIIIDGKYVLAMNGAGYFIGINDQGELVFWTEGKSPNRTFKITPELSKKEFLDLISTLVPA